MIGVPLIVRVSTVTAASVTPSSIPSVSDGALLRDVRPSRSQAFPFVSCKISSRIRNVDAVNLDAGPRVSPTVTPVTMTSTLARSTAMSGSAASPLLVTRVHGTNAPLPAVASSTMGIVKLRRRMDIRD